MLKRAALTMSRPWSVMEGVVAEAQRVDRHKTQCLTCPFHRDKLGSTNSLLCNGIGQLVVRAPRQIAASAASLHMSAICAPLR